MCDFHTRTSSGLQPHHSLHDTTLCPSWHSVQSPSCSQFSSQYLIKQNPDSSSFYSSSHILFILCTTLFKAFPFITDLRALHSWGDWIFAHDSRRIYSLFLTYNCNEFCIFNDCSSSLLITSLSPFTGLLKWSLVSDTAIDGNPNHLQIKPTNYQTTHFLKSQDSYEGVPVSP